MSLSDEVISGLLTALSKVEPRNFSRHFDELGVAKEASSVEFWRNGAMITLVEKLRSIGEDRTILMVFPFACSEKVVVTESGMESISTDAKEPATIYLIEFSEFFDNANEEYRRKSDIFVDTNLQCVFRSWRDDDAAAQGWEFNNALYVWSSVGAGKPIAIS